MIKTITITNHLNESLSIELTNPDASGFIIKSIDGLGPAKANINVTNLITNDGGRYNSARLDTRNIVLSLAFIESPTIEDTRLKSYRFFPIKKNITFKIETDRRVCEIMGYVESNEPDIFSDSEGCQISIICPDPYFKAIKPGKVLFNSVEPKFKFPFKNDSLTEKLINFGNIKRNTEESIIYSGDNEVGVLMTIHALGPIIGLALYHVESNSMIKINDDRLEDMTGSKIIFGDDIVINSAIGEKKIELIRNGTVYNILNVLDRPINWFMLRRGVNTFSYAVEDGLSNLQMTIEYKILYEGV